MIGPAVHFVQKRILCSQKGPFIFKHSSNSLIMAFKQSWSKLDGRWSIQTGQEMVLINKHKRPGLYKRGPYLDDRHGWFLEQNEGNQYDYQGTK